MRARGINQNDLDKEWLSKTNQIECSKAVPVFVIVNNEYKCIEVIKLGEGWNGWLTLMRYDLVV